jgi:hypothetical protein
LSAITYWAYPVVHDRYFANEDAEPQTTQESSSEELCDDGTVCDIETPNESNDNQNSSDADASGDNQPENTPEESLPQESFIEITDKDCDNECEFYDGKEESYCFQVCGLSSVPVESNDECEDLNNLEKDYCLKSQAVEKTDFSICREIEDKNIRETCQNRVTEDIIDNQ